MASTFTPKLGLEKPANNDCIDTWDQVVNANMDRLDAALHTLPLRTSDPPAPAPGDAWIRTDLSELRLRAADATLKLTLTPA